MIEQELINRLVKEVESRVNSSRDLAEARTELGSLTQLKYRLEDKERLLASKEAAGRLESKLYAQLNSLLSAVEKYNTHVHRFKTTRLAKRIELAEILGREIKAARELAADEIPF